MRKFVFGLLCIFIATNSAIAADWRELAVETAKEEMQVHDAIWSQEESFWVSVTDDGTPRDGFADYICVTLVLGGKPKGEIVIVTIVDHAEMLKGKFRALGKHGCR